YGSVEGWEINPRGTDGHKDNTRIKVSFESYHDHRTADRGNPSIGTGTLANPAPPFAPNGDLTKFFGSPTLNRANADVNMGMMFIEHDFENGLTVKNGTLLADYDKFYQNVFPGTSVNPATGLFKYSAYHNTTNRVNAFDQTDFTYKTFTGPLFHTVGFGTEFGRQSGISLRDTGIFPNGSNLSPFMDAFSTPYFRPVTLIHHPTGPINGHCVATPDANSRYVTNIQSAYVRDTVEVAPWLQLIGGVRFDRFDLSALDQNTNTNRERVDNLVSPQGAIIIKPRQNLSFYAVYSQSYLPASGDQFSQLNNGTLIIQPQGFENEEVGVKWNILPHLLYSAAVYQLDRTNVPLADPNNPGFFILSGKNRIRGFENELTGYVTDAWQAKFGYAYTDARVTSATSATILPGNRIQLVPLHQFSLWN